MPLPARMMPEIREQIEAVRRVHKENLAARYAGGSSTGVRRHERLMEP